MLIANIKKAERDERLTGTKITRRSPAISLLLFENDILFFCKAKVDQCQTILDIIGNYGKALGQEINFGKSSIGTIEKLIRYCYGKWNVNIFGNTRKPRRLKE